MSRQTSASSNKQADLHDPPTFNISFCSLKGARPPKTMIRGMAGLPPPLDPPVSCTNERLRRYAGKLSIIQYKRIDGYGGLSERRATTRIPSDDWNVHV